MIFAMPLTSGVGFAQQASNDVIAPRCDIGPIQRTYGEAAWLVFSCSDEQTLIVAPGPENPLRQSYFTLVVEQGGLQVMGVGEEQSTGFSDALDELTNLTAREAVSLIHETKRIPPAGALQGRRRP